jgi:hypothetical protein
MTPKDLLQLGLGHSVVVACLSICRAMTPGKTSKVRFAESSRVGSEQRAAQTINWVDITNALTVLHQHRQGDGGTGPEDASP